MRCQTYPTRRQAYPHGEWTCLPLIHPARIIFHARGPALTRGPASLVAATIAVNTTLITFGYSGALGNEVANLYAEALKIS